MNTSQELVRDVVLANRIALVILETIEKKGDAGLPSGPVFEWLNKKGCNLSEFRHFIGTLLYRNVITTPNPDVYVITDVGRVYIKKLRAAVFQMA
jgi:hypothetical protein